MNGIGGVNRAKEFDKQLALNSIPKSSNKDGWFFTHKKLDIAIRVDYKNFIQELPPEERKSAQYAYWYEDGARHAVIIQLQPNGVLWKYILIYDKDHRRINVIKFQSDVV